MSASRQMSWQACAACKHQRRKCYTNCKLARYFPPERSQEFINVHRVFGVSNLIKMCNGVPPEQRDAFMNSIIYEAEMRCKDPVRGCLGVVCDLSAQISSMKKELEAIQQIMFHRNHEQNISMMNQQYQFEGIKQQQPPPPQNISIMNQQYQFGGIKQQQPPPPVLSNSATGNEANRVSPSNLPSLTIDDMMAFDQADWNVSNMPQF